MTMSDLATQAVIALSIVLVVWYFVGSQMNRRRAMRLLRWIREGLPTLDGEATMNWIGRSAFQVNVKKAKPPFKHLALMVLLEPREVLLVWLFNRLRGQRDLLVLKAELRNRPRAEAEVVPKGGRITRKILKAIEGETWAKGEIEDADLLVLRKGTGAVSLAERLAPLLREHAPDILRLSLRKESPQFLVNLSLPGLEEVTAEALFGLMQEMAEVMAFSK